MITNLVIDYAKRISKYSPQIYRRNGDESTRVIFEAIALSILLFIDEDHYLVSAGHVFENKRNDDFGILVNGRFTSITGDLIFVSSSHDPISHNIDIAIWKLANNIVNSLNDQYSFLMYDQLQFHHDITSISRGYIVYGYPYRKSRLNPLNNKIKIDPFIFVTYNSELIAYDNLKMDKSINIVFDYVQRKVVNLKTGYQTKGVTLRE